MHVKELPAASTAYTVVTIAAVISPHTCPHALAVTAKQMVPIAKADEVGWWHDIHTAGTTLRDGGWGYRRRIVLPYAPFPSPLRTNSRFLKTVL